MLVEEDSFSKAHRNVHHQRRGAKITATVRPTLERSTYIMKYINFLDGSGTKKDPLLNPFLWDYKTRPKALNKRLDGWLKILNFLEKSGFLPFREPKTGVVTGIFMFSVWKGSCNEKY